MKSFNNLLTYNCSSNTAKVWKALALLLKNPHFINRRISTSTQINLYRLIDIQNIKVVEWFTNIIDEFVKVDNVEERVLESFKQSTGGNICNVPDDFLANVDYSNNNTIYLRFAKLLPRNLNQFSQTLEIALIDLRNNSVIFWFLKYLNDSEKKPLVFDLPYQIKYENNNISILSYNSNSASNNDNINWLKNYCFQKLVKWVENDAPKSSLVNCSLKLLSPEKYTKLYNDLKLKYGAKMVQIWPENTDPLKFVYEDVAIASYLLLLWELERDKLSTDKKQSFVDIGCGNGLLVHILNSEGYPGFGIDLRRRKIWNFYPQTTQLKEKTFIPSSKSLFPETDWLIGNHSDELTPWLPVVAARSSFKCRFFVLPCCAYEFNGTKYERQSSANSQYIDYMLYIQSISEECGFKTDIDKLRIPSTKRICIIGTERTYSIEESEKQDLKIQEMINRRCNDTESKDSWSGTFKPRDTIEKVRNCTQINRSLISQIIDNVASLLLRKVRVIDFDNETEEAWNAGGVIELSEIAAALSSDMLKELKNECGGLQTLLRNNGDIFKIELGKVRFRIPGKEKAGSKKLKKNNVTRKVKRCWFYQNHPNKCPLTNEECDFVHSE